MPSPCGREDKGRALLDRKLAIWSPVSSIDLMISCAV
jgi:hypothetical protein